MKSTLLVLHRKTTVWQGRKSHPQTPGVHRVILAFVILFLTWAPSQTTQAKVEAQGSPYAVIDAVNAVRAANGLAPFQVNGALMAAAQAHSEYQASIGSTTHTGRGGSDVKSRALAAGYGGGANVSVIENIYGGMKATPQQAVGWWQGDSIHLQTLLSTRHTEAGAGVAVSDAGVVYYTLDVGAVLGGSSVGSESGSSPVASSSGPTIATADTALAFSPLKISTPGPDGAIIHVVEPGQTLWAIAAIYDINILELLSLNGLNANAYIVPGQKIVIRPAGSMPTATAEAAETTAKPTRTPRPSATPSRASTQPADFTPTPNTPETPKPAASVGGSTKPGLDPLLVGIIGLMLGGIALVLAGNVMKRAG